MVLQISANAGLFLARYPARRYRPAMIDDIDIWRVANLLMKRQWRCCGGTNDSPTAPARYLGRRGHREANASI
jgi:hypothetical protein